MGGICSTKPDILDEQYTSQPKVAEPQARETSTVYRERLINLHDKYRRMSQEEEQHKAKAAPSGDGSAAPKEKERYQRFLNVFAAPLKLMEDFIAPVFPKSAQEVQFLDHVVSKTKQTHYIHCQRHSKIFQLIFLSVILLLPYNQRNLTAGGQLHL